jgi:hypothetical protein
MLILSNNASTYLCDVRIHTAVSDTIFMLLAGHQSVH